MRSVRTLLVIFLLIALPAFTQIVHIPDPNLDPLIREELNIPRGRPYTEPICRD